VPRQLGYSGICSVLLRLHEGDQVMAAFVEHMGVKVISR
jgi:hypothetical protein